MRRAKIQLSSVEGLYIRNEMTKSVNPPILRLMNIIATTMYRHEYCRMWQFPAGCILSLRESGNKKYINQSGNESISNEINQSGGGSFLPQARRTNISWEKGQEKALLMGRPQGNNPRGSCKCALQGADRHGEARRQTWRARTLHRANPPENLRENDK